MDSKRVSLHDSSSRSGGPLRAEEDALLPRCQVRFSELSALRQIFIRQSQQTGFGRIVGLDVRDGEPVFAERTEVLVDVKLDSDEVSRPEQKLSDFLICDEVLRLFGIFDAMCNGSVEHIEIRAGVPRRVLFRAPNQRTES